MGNNTTKNSGSNQGAGQTSTTQVEEARRKRDEIGDVFDSDDRGFYYGLGQQQYNSMVGLVEEFGDDVDDQILSEDDIKNTIAKHGVQIHENFNMGNRQTTPAQEEDIDTIFEEMIGDGWIVPVGDGTYVTNAKGFHMTDMRGGRLDEPTEYGGYYPEVHGADALRYKSVTDTSD